MAGLKQAWLESRRSTGAIVFSVEQAEYSKDNLFLFGLCCNNLLPSLCLSSCNLLLLLCFGLYEAFLLLGESFCFCGLCFCLKCSLRLHSCLAALLCSSFFGNLLQEVSILKLNLSDNKTFHYDSIFVESWVSFQVFLKLVLQRDAACSLIYGPGI